MARMLVNLDVRELNALALLAARERRDPRQQAAHLISDALKRRHLLRGEGSTIGRLRRASTESDGNAEHAT